MTITEGCSCETEAVRAAVGVLVVQIKCFALAGVTGSALHIQFTQTFRGHLGKKKNGI